MIHFCSKGDLVNLKKVVEEQKLDVNEGDYDKRTGMKFLFTNLQVSILHVKKATSKLLNI
jgi:hypothetical protein